MEQENKMKKKREITDEERQARYIIERERVVQALLRLEKKHGWQGVLAAFQHWFKNPARGSFDWYVKDKP